MKKNATKVMSLFLTLCLLCSLFVVPASAVDVHNISVVPGNYTVDLSSTTVEDGGSFTFTVEVNEAYSQSQYSVYSNAWEITPDSNGVYTVSNVTEDQTIVLYNLQKNTYTVTFILPDGSMSRKTGVEHGTQLVAAEYPAVAARDGYTVSWDVTNPTITKNTTITGTYVPTSSNYSITYDLNGGNWAASAVAPTQYNGTSVVTIPNPVKDGATFLGWVGTNLTAATKDVIIAAGASGNRTYTAVWSNSNAAYTVSFNMNGHGTQISNITGISYGSTISVPTAPTAEGYTFGGWYQDQACTSAWNFSSNLVTKNITLYAKWTVSNGSGTGNGSGNNSGNGNDSDVETDNWSDSKLDGYIKIETDYEVTIDGGKTTTVKTEKKTNIRTGEVTETVTTIIEDEDNGIESIIVVEEDKDGKTTAVADSYIYGFYEDEEEDEDELTKLTIKNESDEDIHTLYMNTKKSNLNDSKNMLTEVLKDGKSVKKEADLSDDDKWYFRALDDDGDVIVTDYVTFEDADDCKSATIIIGEESITLEKEVSFSKKDSDVVFEFDDDRVEALVEQLKEAYDIATDADRDAEVNATFFATLEDAASTEICLPTELVEGLADYTNGHIYFETLDCTLAFPTNPTWTNLEREVRKELVIKTETNGDAVIVDVKDNKTTLTDFGPYTITFPYDGTLTPNIVGYILSSATDKNGTLVQKSYNKNGCVVIPVSSSAIVTAKSNAKTFHDNTSVWSVDAIRFVTAREIFNGTAENVYSPNVGMNRAMIVTILYRLEGSPATTGTQHFTDVPADHWAYNAVNWAKEQNIVDGVGNGYFNPSDLITREQLTKILFTYENYLGLDTSARADISAYTDVYDSPNWAKDAMSFAVAEGLIYGNGQNTLNPKGIVTRAQMAVVLQRVIEGIN